MALKRFKPALEDCQHAASLQAPTSPNAQYSKTLLRLARCHLVLGAPAPTLSTLATVIAAEPSNAGALQLRKKAKELESHLSELAEKRKKKEWAGAAGVLARCFRVLAAEAGGAGVGGSGGEDGGEWVPIEWRCWKIEIEIARGNWENAGEAAK